MKCIIGLVLICSLTSCSELMKGKTVICRDPEVVSIFGTDYVAVKDCFVTDKN